MAKTELNKTLELHKMWIDGKEGGIKADLRHADLDFSCFPIWCGGSLSVGNGCVLGLQVSAPTAVCR